MSVPLLLFLLMWGRLPSSWALSLFCGGVRVRESARTGVEDPEWVVQEKKLDWLRGVRSLSWLFVVGGFVLLRSSKEVTPPWLDLWQVEGYSKQGYLYFVFIIVLLCCIVFVQRTKYCIKMAYFGSPKEKYDKKTGCGFKWKLKQLSHKYTGQKKCRTTVLTTWKPPEKRIKKV